MRVLLIAFIGLFGFQVHGQALLESNEAPIQEVESPETNSWVTDTAEQYYAQIDFDERDATILRRRVSELINGTYEPINSSYRKNWPHVSFVYSDPGDSNNVLLVYGWDDEDQDVVNDLTRKVSNRGGHSGNWNREHVIPRSKGGSSKDLFNLHPSDIKLNSDRGNLSFDDGEGTAHKTARGWYPGDKWKGDIARVLLYFHLKNGYNLRGVFKGKFTEAGIPVTLIEWNKDDPVDAYEVEINERMQTGRLGQGNRNPFVDRSDLIKLLKLGKTEK